MDTFIQDLYRFAENYEYGTLKDELIRDRIIVGVLDDTLSDRPQAKSDLTLADAARISRQAEARKQNQTVVCGVETQSEVYYVSQPRSHNKQQATNNQPVRPEKKEFSKNDRPCFWCGHQNHDRKYCPARDTICGNCNKKGHFQSVCLSKKPYPRKVHAVEEEEEEDIHFFGEIGSNEDYWNARIAVIGGTTRFKLDTGGPVTVLSDDVQWLQDVELTKTSQVLRGLGNTQLPVKGLFYVTLKYRQSKLTEPIYVVHDQKCSLLSRRACDELGLIRRADKDVDEMNTGPTDFKAESPALFSGLGKLKTESHIRPDAIPFCLYNPRKIPHPLIPKVKSQIETMIQQGVISPVTAPPKWCAGIVPVLKPNGSVRICVDLIHLNKAVQREIHPMPSVDENLAKLGDSKIFSKLNANSGFWPIPLDDESKLLTTFVTPFGRVCFNRLPFGISSAPEIFQRTMSKILEGSEGTLCQMDDVLIHGVDQSEHDGRVRAVLHRLQEAGMTLNDKCEFSRSSIRFIAHIIDSSGTHVDPQKTTAVTQFPVPSDVAGIQRFMGMVNHLGKCIPHLADLSDPLRQLLRKDSVWVGGEPQQKAFEQIRQALVSPTVLAHYYPNQSICFQHRMMDSAVQCVTR